MAADPGALTDGEVAALWQALRDVLQGSTPVPGAQRRRSDAGSAPFELNLPAGARRAAGTTPTCFTGKRGPRARCAGRPWQRYGRGARGAISARGAKDCEATSVTGKTDRVAHIDGRITCGYNVATW